MKWLAAILCVSLAQAWAYLPSPYFECWMVPYLTPFYQFQHFSSVDTVDNSLERGQSANTFGALTTLAFLPEWEAFAEFALTDSTQENFFFDYGTAGLSYLFWDEASADPFSVAITAAVLVPSTSSLRDYATPHLSHCDFDLALSIGKEWWSSHCCYARIWTLGALGVPIRGAPQIRVAMAGERRYGAHLIHAIVYGRIGLGHRGLRSTTFFEGYGPFHVRAWDVGLAYGYDLKWYGTLGIGYSYRLLARNYPKNAHQIIVYYKLPLSF